MSLPAGIPSCSLVQSLSASWSLMHWGISSNILRAPISKSCRYGLCFWEQQLQGNNCLEKSHFWHCLPVACLASAHLSGGGTLRYATVFFTVFFTEKGFTSLFLHVNTRKPGMLLSKGSVSPCCQSGRAAACWNGDGLGSHGTVWGQKDAVRAACLMSQAAANLVLAPLMEQLLFWGSGSAPVLLMPSVSPVEHPLRHVGTP